MAIRAKPPEINDCDCGDDRLVETTLDGIYQEYVCHNCKNFLGEICLSAEP